MVKKKVALDLKNLIRKSSKDYLEKLKEEIEKGLTEYNEELDKAFEHEILAHESKEKHVHDKIEDYKDKIRKINTKVIHKINLNKTVIEGISNFRAKLRFFNIFKNYKNIRKRFALSKFLAKKYNEDRLKKKAIETVKQATLFVAKSKYETKIHEKYRNDLIVYEEALKKQKDEMLQLVIKAEEKLKYENKKKVRAKLELDQIVLRGISALNLQAISLSQNSLHGKIKSLTLYRCREH